MADTRQARSCSQPPAQHPPHPHPSPHPPHQHRQRQRQRHGPSSPPGPRMEAAGALSGAEPGRKGEAWLPLLPPRAGPGAAPPMPPWGSRCRRRCSPFARPFASPRRPASRAARQALPPGGNRCRRRRPGRPAPLRSRGGGSRRPRWGRGLPRRAAAAPCYCLPGIPRPAPPPPPRRPCPPGAAAAPREEEPLRAGPGRAVFTNSPATRPHRTLKAGSPAGFRLLSREPR